MNLADATFVIVDLETSGLDLETSEIVEVGALRCDGALWPDDSFKTLVHTTRPLSAEVRAVHHIGDHDTVNAPRAHDVEAQLASFIPQNAIVVAHFGSGFDFPLLQRIMPEALDGRQLLCSKRLAMHVDPNAPSHSLQSLRYRYGRDRIDTGNEVAHRAMADVLVLREVLGALLWRTGLNRDADDFTEQLLALSASPIWIDRFPFGKYRNTDVRVSTCDDGSYMMWCLKNMGISPDMRWTLETRLRHIIDTCDNARELQDLANDKMATEDLKVRLRERWGELRDKRKEVKKSA